MKDSFNREINYLRISVTDLCNLKCVYCVPEKGVAKRKHEDIISPERIEEIVEAAAKLGITKVRITGGEPLVRHGILEICRKIRGISGIKELCLTTNGVLLKEMAKDLRDSGVDRLNISLDTLDPSKFSRITRGGNIEDVLEGILEARKVGFKNTKINVVLIKNFNNNEIFDFLKFAENNGVFVRFIELMPIGQGREMGADSFVSNEIVEKCLTNLEKIESDGVSVQYKFKDREGGIGLISPLSNSFCKSCSRLRLTCDGKLRPCLHSSIEVDTNGLQGKELEEALKKAIRIKPEKHHLEKGSESNKGMNEIGG